MGASGEMKSCGILALLYSVIANNVAANNITTFRPVLVNVSLELQRISNLAESAMEFTAYLYLEESYKVPQPQASSNADGGDALAGITQFPANEAASIWEPGTAFHNAKYKPHTLDEETQTAPDGTVIRRRRIAVTSFCPMSFRSYPFDSQRCAVEIQSFKYSVDKVRYMRQMPEDPSKIIPLVDETTASGLILKRIECYESNVTYRGMTFSRLRLQLSFKRSVENYMGEFYLPSTMMTIMSWIILWLDHESIAERIGIGVTIILTLHTSVDSISGKVPQTSYQKAIDMYNGVCLSFVTLVIFENLLVIKMKRAHQQRQQNKRDGRQPWFVMKPEDVDKKARIVIPSVFAGFVATYFIIYLIVG